MRSTRQPSRTCSTPSTWARGSNTQSPTSAIVTRVVAEVQVAQPSVIFHLAAQALVRRAYAEPHETFERTLWGRQRARSGACLSVGTRRGGRHERQVLTEPRDRSPVPRDGCDGRP